MYNEPIVTFMVLFHQVTFAEWLRRVPTKYMGIPRERLNLSSDVMHYTYIINILLFTHCDSDAIMCQLVTFLLKPMGVVTCILKPIRSCMKKSQPFVG